MRRCSKMKSSPSGCAPTFRSTPITRHVAEWDSICYNFVLVVQWLDTVRGASGSGSLEGVTKLVPDAWLIRTCQRIVGEGQRPAVRQALVNHGLFHANQNLVYRRNLIVTISDEAWSRLDDRDTQNSFANGQCPLRTTARNFVFKKSMVYLPKFKQTGRTGDPFSRRNHWSAQQASYLIFSQIS